MKTSQCFYSSALQYLSSFATQEVLNEILVWILLFMHCECERVFKVADL